MKKHHLLSLVVFLAMAVVFGLRSSYASANFDYQLSEVNLSVRDPQAAPTPIPTGSQSATVQR